jgi:hypothetical protein
MSRGSAILEALVVGFLAALMVLTSVLVAGRIQVAGEEAAEVARVASFFGARHGDAAGAEALARRLLPGGSVSVNGDGDRIGVVVRQRVDLPNPPGDAEVVGRAATRISPYRSRR